MSESIFDKYIKALKSWKYYYNKENDIVDEILRLLQQHKASENKLGLKKSELELLRGDDNIEDIQTLEKQAVILEHITGIRPNIFKDSVLKWIEIGKLATSINQQRRKHGK